MTDEALYHDPAFARLYDADNDARHPGRDETFCLEFARERGAASLLDLACGTGAFAVRAAGLARVTGVDRAGAMLDVARARDGGGLVEWVEADLRTLDLGRRFDLVTMLGHAFQCLLTPADRVAALGAAARHLAPGGRLIFDSRNPAARAWEGWTRAATDSVIDAGEAGPVRRWTTASRDELTGIVTYVTHYVRAGRTRRAVSQIVFEDRRSIETALGRAGLALERLMGDWNGGVWTPASPEIIPVCRIDGD